MELLLHYIGFRIRNPRNNGSPRKINSTGLSNGREAQEYGDSKAQPANNDRSSILMYLFKNLSL